MGRTTQDAIYVYLENIEEHADTGRKMLVRLMRSSIVQPLKAHAAWADFLVVSDMLIVLHRGVAVLEARLDICAPQGVENSELLSTIHRHRRFEALM